VKCVVKHCSSFCYWRWFNTLRWHTATTPTHRGLSLSAGCLLCAPYCHCQSMQSSRSSSRKAQYWRYPSAFTGKHSLWSYDLMAGSTCLYYYYFFVLCLSSVKINMRQFKNWRKYKIINYYNIIILCNVGLVVMELCPSAELLYVKPGKHCSIWITICQYNKHAIWYLLSLAIPCGQLE